MYDLLVFDLVSFRQSFDIRLVISILLPVLAASSKALFLCSGFKLDKLDTTTNASDVADDVEFAKDERKCHFNKDLFISMYCYDVV